LAGTTARQASAQVRALGANYQPPRGLSDRVVAALTHIVRTSVSEATHIALLFAATVILLGAVVSLLLPTDLPHQAGGALERAEELGGLAPIDAEAEILASADVAR
jgi:hypothetical protein